MVVLRVAAGSVMRAHGIKHARGRTKTKTSGWFGSIGFRMPELRWFASMATEIGVGILLLAGFATSHAASGLVAVMVVAGVGLAIAAGGPGAFSVDSALGIDTVLDGWVGLALVAGGVALAAAQIATFFRPRINAEA